MSSGMGASSASAGGWGTGYVHASRHVDGRCVFLLLAHPLSAPPCDVPPPRPAPTATTRRGTNASTHAPVVFLPDSRLTPSLAARLRRYTLSWWVRAKLPLRSWFSSAVVRWRAKGGGGGGGGGGVRRTISGQRCASQPKPSLASSPPRLPLPALPQPSPRPRSHHLPTPPRTHPLGLATRRAA